MDFEAVLATDDQIARARKILALALDEYIEAVADAAERLHRVKASGPATVLPEAGAEGPGPLPQADPDCAPWVVTDLTEARNVLFSGSRADCLAFAERHPASCGAAPV